jgi:hypothetical protein
MTITEAAIETPVRNDILYSSLRLLQTLTPARAAPWCREWNSGFELHDVKIGSSHTMASANLKLFQETGLGEAVD